MNDFDPKLSVAIPTTRVEGEGGSAFTVYDVQISVYRNEEDSSSWTVSHRYSGFLVLHSQVRKQFPKERLEEFPAKSIFDSSTSTAVVQRRKVALEKYLQHLVNNPLIRAYDPVLSFLFLRDLRRKSITVRPDFSWTEKGEEGGEGEEEGMGGKGEENAVLAGERGRGSRRQSATVRPGFSWTEEVGKGGENSVGAEDRRRGSKRQSVTVRPGFSWIENGEEGEENSVGVEDKRRDLRRQSVTVRPGFSWTGNGEEIGNGQKNTGVEESSWRQSGFAFWAGVVGGGRSTDSSRRQSVTVRPDSSCGGTGVESTAEGGGRTEAIFHHRFSVA